MQFLNMCATKPNFYDFSEKFWILKKLSPHWSVQSAPIKKFLLTLVTWLQQLIKIDHKIYTISGIR